MGWSSFNGHYKYFILVATLFSLGNSNDAFLILRAQNVGISTTVIPLVYLVFNVVYSLGAMPAGILSDRIGPKPIIFVAFVLFGFIYLGFAKANHPVYIWLLFIFYGIFMAMTEGVQKAFLSTIIPQELKAMGFGFYNTLVGLAVLPASLIGGLLWDHFGSQATFLYGTATAWLSACLFIFLQFKGKRK